MLTLQLPDSYPGGYRDNKYFLLYALLIIKPVNEREGGIEEVQAPGSAWRYLQREDKKAQFVKPVRCVWSFK